ncbi:unnamed protein product [Toxocara canis]|uniref:Major sperm protein n=1 Tax=Toxocara canis TaxID=6265 RepID=A0A183UYM0_TOXCA|nr:unnamed protein product [Toxocara canis]
MNGHNFMLFSSLRLVIIFQVKTSNNDCYRVTPVYGFVEKSSKVELTIIRLEGPPKEDKFVVQWAEVPDEETDPQAPFQAGAQAGEVIMAVKLNDPSMWPRFGTKNALIHFNTIGAGEKFFVTQYLHM